MKKVLIIEDEAALRMSIRAGLASHHFQVWEGRDASSGLLCASSEKVGIVTAEDGSTQGSGSRPCKTVRCVGPERLSLIPGESED
jgi:DNA-binding response OmpR family regulator